jgi:hypothetical protein
MNDFTDLRPFELVVRWTGVQRRRPAADRRTRSVSRMAVGYHEQEDALGGVRCSGSHETPGFAVCRADKPATGRGYGAPTACKARHT